MLFDYFSNIEFSHPAFFVLLLLLPLIIFWYIKTNNRTTASINISTLAAKSLGSWKASGRHLPFICRMLSLLFIIIALANPQTKSEEQHNEGEGIDIMLCLDVSGSMTAQDFSPNRLEASKRVAASFVERRKTDRMGVVVFAGESFTQCPLTTDHSVLLAAIENIRSGILADGTAIGDGLSTSVDRLRTNKAASKIVVLLTDGENNGGLVDPKTAKEIAKSFGIKVYTIGVGTEGEAIIPTQGLMGTEMQKIKVSIDEKLLTEIATETGGKYFRAKDNEGLAGIYETIDKLEKSKVDITTTKKFTQKFLPLALAAAFFLLLEMLFRYLVFRKFP